MAAPFAMSQDYQDLIADVAKNDTPTLWDNVNRGIINFKYLGVPKASQIIKVKKEGVITEYLQDETMIVVILLYEEAMEKLDDKYKRLVVANALSAIEYDSEKDKLVIKGGGAVVNERVFLKYGVDAVLAQFNGEHAIHQIEEEKAEEKKRKAEEKKNKNAKK